MDLGKILPLVVGVLGLIGFIAGFLPAASFSVGPTSVSVSVFGGGPSYLPILLVMVGLLACAPLLPGGRKYILPALLLSVAGLLGAIGAVASSTVLSKLAGTGSAGTASKGFGIWLLLIVAVLQLAAIGYAWFTEAGSGQPARPAGERGHAARSFGPTQGSAPAQPAPSGPASPGYAQGEAPSYGGYTPGVYAPSGAPASGSPSTDGFAQYRQPSSDAVPHTGSNPAVDSGSPYSPYGAAPTGPSSPGAPGSSGPGTGQHGRDDGPSPDVTQQVRF